MAAHQIVATVDEIEELLAIADKIDAALPQVSSIESLDIDLDNYATKSIDVFDELVDLGKNVEDRHSAAIFDSATKMMQNALTAKTVKANKKLEMIKLQIAKAKLVIEQEKLEFAKQKYKALETGVNGIDETDGKIIVSRNELLADILNDLKNT